VYLERSTGHLRARGEVPDEALLAFLSPLGWEHINLTGDYVWSPAAGPEAGGFRTLRDTGNP